MRHWPQPTRRPSWWPEGESWPPPAGAWRTPPRRFFFRMAALFASLFFLTVGGCTIAFWLTAVALGYVHWPGPEGGWERLAIAGIVLAGMGGIALTLRGLRRMTSPVEELIAAARRVEAGDYTARVGGRGPAGLSVLARSFNAMVERLERDAQQRRNLLADVTHELKTPLTVMRGTLEGIEDGLYQADAEHLGPVLEEIHQLTRLIDDLQLLGLAEMGALQLQREATDLRELVQDVVASFRPQAEAAGVRLAAEIDPHIPPAPLDPVRIRAVVSNLLSNALRHTPAGGEIRLEAGRGADDQHLHLQVRDTGSGIAPELLPRVFDRFVKGPGSRGRGLGLAIVQDLVRAHGGEISASSEPGKGTTIRIELPLGER